jgi:hypothetical protein
MSTIAIVIFIAIGLVVLMQLTDREDRGSSLAGYVIALAVALGVAVLVVRSCQGTF